MKIILFILLAISVNSFSQEFDEIWKNSNFNDIRAIFHDENENRVFVADRTNYGTLWILNSDDGSIIDTIHTANIYTYINLSPDGNLLIIGNFGATRIYDLLNKELISDFVTNGKTQFIDNHNIYYYAPDEGIFKSDVLNENKINLWNNIPLFDIGNHTDNLAEISPFSCFSKDGRYALVELIRYNDTGFIILIDLIENKELKKYENAVDFPVFSPNSREFGFVHFENVNIYSIDNLDTPKLKYYKVRIGSLIHRFDFTSDGESLMFYGAFPENFILYGENYENYRGLNIQVKNLQLNAITKKGIFDSQKNIIKKDFNEILNVDNDITINIYPNPTSDIINIDTKIPIDIELFDIFGNKLLEDYNTKIDISNLSPGTYYIRYSDQTKMVVKL